MLSEPTVAYHGTLDIESVLKEGLREDAWMALDYEVAARYGDVVKIDLTALPGFEDGAWPLETDEVTLCWQAHTNDLHIPASALSRC